MSAAQVSRLAERSGTSFHHHRLRSSPETHAPAERRNHPGKGRNKANTPKQRYPCSVYIPHVHVLRPLHGSLVTLSSLTETACKRVHNNNLIRERLDISGLFVSLLKGLCAAAPVHRENRQRLGHDSKASEAWYTAGQGTKPQVSRLNAHQNEPPLSEPQRTNLETTRNALSILDATQPKRKYERITSVPQETAQAPRENTNTNTNT